RRLLHAAEAGVFAGQHPARDDLPGAVLQRGARARAGAAGDAHLLRTADPLAQQPEWPAIPVALHGPAQALAVGGDIAAVAEELFLPRRAVARQDAVAAAVGVADAGSHADAQR